MTDHLLSGCLRNSHNYRRAAYRKPKPEKPKNQALEPRVPLQRYAIKNRKQRTTLSQKECKIMNVTGDMIDITLVERGAQGIYQASQESSRAVPVLYDPDIDLFT